MIKKIMIILMMLTVQAFAGSETIDPTSDIRSTGGWTSTGATFWDAVSDASDGTYANLDDDVNEGNNYLVGLGNPTTATDSTLDSLVYHFRFATSNATTTNITFVDSVAGQSSGLRESAPYLPALADTPEEIQILYTLNPDGSAWSWTDVTDLMVGSGNTNIANKQNVTCYETWVVAWYHYTAAAGAGQVIIITGGDD